MLGGSSRFLDEFARCSVDSDDESEADVPDGDDNFIDDACEMMTSAFDAQCESNAQVHSQNSSGDDVQVDDGLPGEIEVTLWRRLLLFGLCICCRES